MGLQMVFTLSVILSGFVIPTIVCFAVFHGKFKALEKEIAGYILQENPIH